MKIQISVEIFNKGNFLNAKDLKIFGAITFLKRLPKLIKKSIQIACWPFDAEVKVNIIDFPKINK